MKNVDNSALVSSPKKIASDKSVCISDEPVLWARRRGRVTQARISIVKSFWHYSSSCMTQSTRVVKYFDLAEAWGGGPEVSDVTGYNSGYWYLGITISVSPKYNGSLCAHYLPADRADSLVNMMDRCKSDSRESRSLADLSTAASLTPSVVVIYNFQWQGSPVLHGMLRRMSSRRGCAPTKDR